MSITVILGTRPEIIRLAPTIKNLRQLGVPLNLIYTNQNYEESLRDKIFADFPGIYDDIKFLDIQESSFFHQIGKMVEQLAQKLRNTFPASVLILGDTNTSLAAALTARKMGIPIYHMEAGNRCFDKNSPEETNRLLIDSISDVHMCYTKYAKQNLLNQGVPQNLIHVIGNPMAEFEELHEKSKKRNHILCTFHRQENIQWMPEILQGLEKAAKKIDRPAICYLHPRVLSHARNYVGQHCTNVDVWEAVGPKRFFTLEKTAAVIVTDSGTVCEEAAMVHRPSVIIRKTMERPELFDTGNTILSGPESRLAIAKAVEVQFNQSLNNWEIPEEYQYQKVSRKVINIILGKGNYI